MSKGLLVIAMSGLFIAGCNSLGSAAAQSITLPNGKQGYSIDCTLYSGWPACFEVAGTVCKSGYSIHERSMDEFTKSEIPVEPLQQENIDYRPGKPYPQEKEQKGKYMIISCK